MQVPRHHSVDILKEVARPGLFSSDPEHIPHSAISQAWGISKLQNSLVMQLPPR